MGDLSFFDYLLAGILVSILTWALSFTLLKVAARINALDHPDGDRKQQAQPVSFLGGTAIVSSIVIIHVLCILVMPLDFNKLNLLLVVAVPGIAIFSIGLIDDFVGLKPYTRLIFQFAIATLVTDFLQSRNLGVKFFEQESLNFVTSVMWIVLVCNAINLYDNTDLASSSATFIANLGIFLIALNNSQYYLSFMSSLTCGAIIGFMIWNRPAAKLYLGDSGALLLGVLTAVQLIQLRPTTNSVLGSATIPFLLVAMPLLDTTMVILSRIKRGISPFTPGRDHIAHRMQSEHPSVWKVIVKLTALSSFFATFAIVLDLGLFSSDYFIAFFCAVIWIYLAIRFSRKGPTTNGRTSH